MNKNKNIGRRILAGFLDYILFFTFFFVYVYSFGEPNEEGGYTVNGLPALVPVLFWLILIVGVEQWLGATIGNKIAGLKPVSIEDENRKLSFVQSLKRHLLDFIDMFFFGAIGIITINNTSKNQRVGDIWAKTTVIKDN